MKEVRLFAVVRFELVTDAASRSLTRGNPGSSPGPAAAKPDVFSGRSSNWACIINSRATLANRKPPCVAPQAGNKRRRATARRSVRPDVSALPNGNLDTSL
jgi:hypothetical protein